MAIGLAFVDIVGDTSRTEEQVERDMNRVLAVVEDSINPVEINAAVEAGTEQDLTREINSDIRAAQQAIQAIQVDARLSAETRRELTASLRRSVTAARAAIGEIQLRVDQRPIIEETVAAVVEAVQVAEAAAPPIELETTVDRDVVARLQRDFSGVASAARSAAGAVGSLTTAASGLTAGVQASTALLATLKALAPAASVAAPAILSVVSSTNAIKLAMVGVEDAIKAAMDPSDPKAFNEALKGLAPAARDFAREVRVLQPEFKALQRSVQQEFFAGLDDSLSSLAESTLPLLHGHLTRTAGALRGMAVSAAGAAQQLAERGVLGQALDGTAKGLESLTNLPGVVVKAFGELAAAAAPAFNRLTTAIAGEADEIGQKLSAAFESGGLEKAIGFAIDQVKLLFDVLGNVGRIFQNITSEAAGFQGILAPLERITQVLADATGTETAQQAFDDLFGTVNKLVSTALPLLGQAFGIVAQVVSALAPGAQELINALGRGLTPVVSALGPVLVAAAGAVSALVTAFSPLIQFAGNLIATILPAFVPILNGIAAGFSALAPVISELADILGAVLVPIFAQLPSIITPFVQLFVRVAEAVLPVVLQLLQELRPSLEQIAVVFVEIAVALAPVLNQLAQLVITIGSSLSPLIGPLIRLVGQLAQIFVGELATQLRTIVLPAIRALSQLLSGDLSGSFRSLRDLSEGVITSIIRLFAELPVKVLKALAGLGSALFDIGVQIMASLIRGIRSGTGPLGSVLSGITDFIRENKGPIEEDRRLLTPAGLAIMESLRRGLQMGVPGLRGDLAGITAMVGGTSMGAPGVSFGAGGRVQTASAAGFAASSGPPSAAGAGGTTVQVFIGERELTSIVDTRIVQNNRAQSRLLTTGVRG